jgi:hypothetical protein
VWLGVGVARGAVGPGRARSGWGNCSRAGNSSSSSACIHGRRIRVRGGSGQRLAGLKLVTGVGAAGAGAVDHGTAAAAAAVHTDATNICGVAAAEAAACSSRAAVQGVC